MKVYSTPVPFENKWDDDWQKHEADHQEQVKAWLQANGYSGPRTGEVLSFGVGDGCASYMYADAPGAKACLIHLPYGDAYQYPDVRYLPKKEVLRRLDSQKRVAALFS